VTAAARQQGWGIGGKSYRTAALLAWSLCALTLVLTALSLWLSNLNLQESAGTTVAM
jgi:hypothetical protein